MRVENQCRSGVPNFGQINRIQIPKSAFSKPDEINKCFKTFNKSLNQASAGGGVLGRITAGLMSKLKNKTLTLFESTTYKMCEKDMKALKFDSKALARHLNNPQISQIAEKDSFVFYVFTKEDKDSISDKINYSFIDKMKLKYAAADEYPENVDLQQLYINSKRGLKCDKELKQSIKGANVHNFNLESLDGIKKIVSKLGL